MDTNTFFNSFLPTVLARQPAIAHGAPARIGVVVHGVGTWTVTLGRDVAVTTELDLDAELVVAFSSEGFDRLLAGEGLRADGSEPVCIGDAHLLERLGHLITAPAQGGVSAQLAFRQVA